MHMGGNKAPGWATGIKDYYTGTVAPYVSKGLSGAAGKVHKAEPASMGTGVVTKKSVYNPQYLAQRVLDRAFRG